MGVFYIYQSRVQRICAVFVRGYIYTSVWGFRRCSFRLNWAMLEPFYRGTSDRTGSTLFCIYLSITHLFTNVGKAAAGAKFRTMSKRGILVLLVSMFALVASAQDIIVKKSGDAVACRIVEVGQKVVVFKLWSDLQGNDRVMDVSDIASIRYENGQKKKFGITSGVVESPVFEHNNRYVDNGALLAVASREANNKKAKRLKKTGWIVGSIAVVVGFPLWAVGLANNCEYNNSSPSEDLSDGIGLLAAGGTLMTVGIATTTFCLVKANKLKNRQTDFVQSIPVL